MTDSAIQQDVEKEVPQAISARNEALASIAERARQERDEEIKSNGGEIVDTLNVEEKQEEEKEEKIEEVQEPKDEVKEEAEEPKIEVVKIKVDGEEREVPKDKILDAGIRALQKESTADKRLEEATRLLREVEQKYVQPQEKKQETPSQEWDDATVAYALEHGSEEQKAYAVSLLRGRGNTTQDAEVIEQRAVIKALDTVDFRDSSQWFQTEYKDIVADPYLFQLAASAEANARANGDQRSRKDLYKAIGDDLRKWKGGVTVTNSLEEKKEHKSNIVNLPSASVKKSTPAEAKPKTTADVIEQMRKSRGQR